MTLKTKRRKKPEAVEVHDVEAEVDADELCSTFGEKPACKEGEVTQCESTSKEAGLLRTRQYAPGARSACSRGLFSHGNEANARES